MPYPYNAIIERQSRKITGMDAGGKYCLDGNEKLEIKPLEPETFRAFTLREVSKLTLTGGKWLLDGEDITGRWLNPLGEDGIDSEARTDMKTIGWLRQTLNGLPIEVQTKIKGVAWFVERVEEVAGRPVEAPKKKIFQVDGKYFECESGSDAVPPAEEFEPILLTDFGIIAGMVAAAPDFFTNIRDAAAYAGKTERTILNWKKSGWLKAEQDGKKIRIAKAELDKCIGKQ